MVAADGNGVRFWPESLRLHPRVIERDHARMRMVARDTHRTEGGFVAHLDDETAHRIPCALRLWRDQVLDTGAAQGPS